MAQETWPSATIVPHAHPTNRVRGVPDLPKNPAPQTWQLRADQLFCDDDVVADLRDVVAIRTERLPLRRHNHSRAPIIAYWRRLELRLTDGRRVGSSFRSGASDRPIAYLELRDAIIERVAQLNPEATMDANTPKPFAGWVLWIVSQVIGWPLVLTIDAQPDDGSPPATWLGLGLGIVVLLGGLMAFGYWLAAAAQPRDASARQYVLDRSVPGRRHPSSTNGRGVLVSVVLTTSMAILYAIVIWQLRIP